MGYLYRKEQIDFGVEREKRMQSKKKKEKAKT